jgi:PLP dependent protein
VTLTSQALAGALAEVRTEIAIASALAGTPPAEVIVAGKYVAQGDAQLLVDAGIRVVGENRLQDLVAKRALVGDGLVFDFIGHLQRRKVRDVLGVCRLIHSVDSLELAEEIARRAEGTVRVLVEVNQANEPTKHGIAPAELRRFIDHISAWPNLVVGGLMSMPPMAVSAEGNRHHFAALRVQAAALAAEWQGRHDVNDLSMGTSQDFLVAASEGATMVRLGRGLFQRAKG